METLFDSDRAEYEHTKRTEPKPTKRTIFVGVFQYKDKEYTIHCDFGKGYPAASAEWMFLEGNYSCDCNRSLFIAREYGEDAIPELECGEKIKLKEYHIEYLDEEATDERN